MLKPRFGFTRFRLLSLTIIPFFETLDVLGRVGIDSSGMRMDVATVEAIVAVRLCWAFGGGDQPPCESAVKDVMDEMESDETVLPERRWEWAVVGGDESW